MERFALQTEALTETPSLGSDHTAPGCCVTCGGALGSVGPGGYAIARADDEVLARVCSEACYHGYWSVVFRRYQACVGV